MTDKQLNAIKELQKLCEDKEDLRLKLNWSMLKEWEEGKDNGLFYYEGEELVGFLGIYEFGKKVELCGMVHPAYRRNGIFKTLMDKALCICEEKDYREILLNAPANGEAAKGFIENTPSSYLFSEHEMKWSGTEVQDDTGIVIRETREEDKSLEIELDVQCFGFKEIDALLYNNQIRAEVKQGLYIIEYEKNAIGKIRVERTKGESWIYGFAILPKFQGRGIGRAALKKIIQQEHKQQNDIYLEVDSNNHSALHLYESLGFQAYYTQDYYLYKKK